MLQIHPDKNVHFLSVRLSFYHVLGERAIISGEIGMRKFQPWSGILVHESRQSRHPASLTAQRAQPSCSCCGGKTERAAVRRIKNAVDPSQDVRQIRYETGRALQFVFPGKVLGVQGTGGVEHSQHHHAHIGKDGGPHAGHADRAQHKAGKLDGQCKHDVLVHDA